MTWQDEDMPVPMSLYSYMLLVDDDFYYFGVGEPFLAGESCKRFMEEFAETIVIGKPDKSSKGNEANSKKETAAEDNNNKTEDKKAEDNDKKEKKSSQKGAYPSLSEVYGSYGMVMTMTRNDTGESYSDMSVYYITAEELTSYDEKTGKGHMNLEDIESGTMEFYYRNDGGDPVCG